MLVQTYRWCRFRSQRVQSLESSNMQHGVSSPPSEALAVAGVQPRRAVTSRRLIAAVVAATAATILGVAAWMTPSPTGLGTHRTLNLPPCGWIAVADLPCPTCGMTTAFAHAADGNLIASFHAQPMGFMLAIAVAVTLLVSVQVAITGSRLGWIFTRLWGRRSGWALALLVIAAWAYKIASYKGWIG